MVNFVAVFDVLRKAVVVIGRKDEKNSNNLNDIFV